MFITPRIILHLFASHVGFVVVAVLIVADFDVVFVVGLVIDVVIVDNFAVAFVVILVGCLIVALAPVYNAPISFCIRGS